MAEAVGRLRVCGQQAGDLRVDVVERGVLEAPALPETQRRRAAGLPRAEPSLKPPRVRRFTGHAALQRRTAGRSAGRLRSGSCAVTSRYMAPAAPMSTNVRPVIIA